MQDINPAPASLGEVDSSSERRFIGYIRLECQAFGALLGNQCSGLICGIDIPVYRENLCAFLCEADRSRAAVARTFSRALSGADDDGYLSGQSHEISRVPAFRYI